MSRKLFRVRKRDEMPTRKHFHIRAQSLPCNAPLKAQRKESIACRGDHVDRHAWPVFEFTGLPENRVSLLTILRRSAQERLWNIVQEVRLQVEFDAIATLSCGSGTGTRGSRVVPPLTGRFPRSWDHGVDQNEHLDGYKSRDERSGETAERLSNQNHVTPLPDRLDDDVGVLLETRADIIAWQINSDRIRPSPLEEGCHSMPVPRHSPRARDQNVRGS